MQSLQASLKDRIRKRGTRVLQLFPIFDEAAVNDNYISTSH
jgi:hypothetical protein